MGTARRSCAVNPFTPYTLGCIRPDIFPPDPANLVATSIAVDKPFIAVTLNYRLNMFAFGDQSSNPNLALRDQRRALEYVQQHIAGFGGDPVGPKAGNHFSRSLRAGIDSCANSSL